MTRVCLLIVMLAPAFAQKKPVTLETFEAQPHEHGSIGATWAPDGKSFVFPEDKKLKLYDCATKTSRELASTEALENAAVKPAAGDRPFDWQNSNTRDGEMTWSQSGKGCCCTRRAATFF